MFEKPVLHRGQRDGTGHRLLPGFRGGGRENQGRKFLEDGHKVLVVCVFRGRQRARPEMGTEVMRRVAESLADIAKVEQPSRMTGNRMIMLLTPILAPK